MNTIFGIPANTLLTILLIAFGLCLASTAWVFIRHRAVFRLGIRNIPRRPAQTILIVIGLMLSTTIIAAALTTGDIMDHTIRSDVFEIAGYSDEFIVPAAANAEHARPQAGVTFPESVVHDLQAEVGDDPDIDGLMPVLSEMVPAVHPRAELGEPVLAMVGIDFKRLEPFGGLQTIDGQPIDFDALAPDEIILGQRPASSLDAGPGDTLTIFVQGHPIEVEVAAIAPDTLFTGYSDPGVPGGFAVALESAQSITGKSGQISFIAVTNAGGIEDGVLLTDQVTLSLQNALDGTELAIVPVKQNALESAENVAAVYSSLFLVFGTFSIAAGILLIFLIFVLLAAERKPEMGINRALGMKRRQLTQMFMTEGLAYDLGAALVGALLGIGVAIVMVDFMSSVVGEGTFQVRTTASWRSLVIAYTLGVTITFITIAISAWHISRLNIVSAIRNLPDPEQAGTRSRDRFIAALAIFASIVMLVIGYNALSPFLFAIGVSLLPFSLVPILRRFGLSSRLLYTGASLLLLVYWLFPVRQAIGIAPDMGTGGMEMFVLSGLMLVTGATVLIMWNANLITWLVASISRRFSRWVPAVKTAVSYPMANRGRTGLTIAMFSLIIFSLVMMASMNANFSQAFEGEYATAGWDIQVRQNPNNPIVDLTAALESEDFSTGEIVAQGRALELAPFAMRLRLAGTEEWRSYQTVGVDTGFLDIARSEAPVSIMAEGYETSAQVWDAVRDNPNLAVIDGLAVPSPVVMMLGIDFELTGLGWGDTMMTPIDVEIFNRSTGDAETITIIGVIDPRVSLLVGMIVNEESFARHFEQPTEIVHYTALAEGTDAPASAAGMERALVTYGAQSATTREILESRNRESRGFLYLFEGFMGLGLVVGIAALGVISYRAVVERRQQIGMLRAIGYRRSMLAASFVLESTIVTMLGVLSGVVLGLLLTRQLMQAEEFAGTLGGAALVIPWGQIMLFCLIALIASLIMAYIPARQAARVPIAAALRYE